MYLSTIYERINMMKSIVLNLSIFLIIATLTLAKESLNEQKASALPTTIDNIRAMLPIKDVQTGYKMLDMLKNITSPELADEKVPLLVMIYESQNAEQSNAEPDEPGMPTVERRLQIEALDELAKIQTNKCIGQVSVILQEYLDFINSQESTHIGDKLQLSMSELIAAYINNSDIRTIGTNYLSSPVIAEWTKGRITTSLLAYNIQKISDKDDPDMTKRLALIMDAACLSSLEEMLKAPARIGRSAKILSELTTDSSKKLISFIEAKGHLSDPQKYFLGYALLYRAIRKTQTKQPLDTTDAQLEEMTGQWYTELVGKTKKMKGDHIFESLKEQRDNYTNNK